MKIYNTLTRKKETFTPIEEGKVKLYTCGPTVYNYFHIGNARAFLFFDVVRKYFEYKGYDVTYVQNITDIDDKIINQANEDNRSWDSVASEFSQAFLDDTKSLGISKPDYQPKATEYIDEMIKMIDELVKKGIAYESAGDVYFAVTSVKDYGKLSKKNLEDLKAGARVEENTNKRHPSDFTLWKKAKPGEPKWASPWGEGRPGWHTECVVMSQSLLGENFDIHGGGSDLVFPHHENEIAQAKALTGKQMATYWMHNGFLNIKGEKMSKSLNNFFTARDILKQYDAEAIRFFFLSKHYRSPIDFNEELIQESKRAVDNFYDAFSSLNSKDFLSNKADYSDELLKYRDKFKEAMDDDFNTAVAISVLFDLSKKIKTHSFDISERNLYAKLMCELGSVLGFFGQIHEKLSVSDDGLSGRLVELLISYRAQFKKDKNWSMADQVRDDLKSMGVELSDTAKGTDWKIIKS